MILFEFGNPPFYIKIKLGKAERYILIPGLIYNVDYMVYTHHQKLKCHMNDILNKIKKGDFFLKPAAFS